MSSFKNISLKLNQTQQNSDKRIRLVIDVFITCYEKEIEKKKMNLNICLTFSRVFSPLLQFGNEMSGQKQHGT